MEIVDGQIQFPAFTTVTIGILALFLGKFLNSRIRALREFTIPEPVSGGLLIALLITFLHVLTGLEISFGLRARDVLLVYFFTTVGINASFHDLRRGGRSLLVLVLISAAVMVAQNLLGVTVAPLGGLPPATGLLAGTVSLVGGHGTTIAWAETFRDVGIDKAKEIGIAAATIGLVLASATGGPIARFLIGRHHLRTPGTGAAGQEIAGGSEAGGTDPAATSRSEAHGRAIDSLDFLGAIFAINICIILGSILQELIQDLGLFLPLFVPCLLVGVLISNLLHGKETPGPLHWPCRTPALALVADISLGAFLAMSLMSLQLWSLVDLAGPLLLILLAQLLMAILLTVLLVFPLLGGDYDAAVLATGFYSIVLGSTPTGMANMTAITERFGPSYRAFILLPLLSAFFIDLLNAVLIPAFLARFS